MIAKRKATNVFLLLFIAGVFVLPFVSSCGKNPAVTGASSHTQFEVLNLSPDVGPVHLFGNFVDLSPTAPYIYTNPPAYFFISPSDTILQIRPGNSLSQSLVSFSQGTNSLTLGSNHKYSMFITGRVSDKTLAAFILPDDTAAVATVGYGKLRFVNASIQVPDVGINITANGTVAFLAIKSNKVSSYVQLPAGNYNFQISSVNSPTTFFTTPSTQAVTIQDGRLYTLYTYGIVGQTDTAAFNAAIITNR